MVTKAKRRGKTIWLTEEEFALLNESRELFTGFTKKKISWGAYLCALGLGSMAAKALTGLLIRCPDCGAEVAMTLENPVAKRFRRPPGLSHPGPDSEPRSQTQEAAAAGVRPPQP